MKVKAGYFIPTQDQDRQEADRIGIGEEVKASRARNPAFHRKLFALLNLAYENWNPPIKETKWGLPKKSFTRFRKDMLILAGHFELTISIKGEPKVEAESLAYENMGSEKFEIVYKDVLREVEKLIGTKSAIIEEQLAGYY